MKRLTRKDKRTLSGYYIPSDYSNYHEKEFIKLGQLEDIEEELGIELITLFNAEKVYYKYCEGSKYIYESIEVHFDLTNRVLRVYEYPEDEFGLAFQLSEYNRLWSLRKEDLEDE